MRGHCVANPILKSLTSGMTKLTTTRQEQVEEGICGCELGKGIG